MSKVANQVHGAISNQLRMMKFFKNDDIDDIPKTPLTNLGCKSKFGSVSRQLVVL